MIPEDGPIRFQVSDPTPLPDKPDELLEVIRQPRSVNHCLQAMTKLGDLYGRDIVSDNISKDFASFHPAITAAGVGNDAEAIRSFCLFAVPLRRVLGDYYQARTPDVAMLIDLLTLAYFRVLQAERATVALLSQALDNPHLIDRAASLEKIKDLASRQMVRLLEALRMATGRRLPLDPDQDAAKILRFPVTFNQHHKRHRKVSVG